jgi:hypothetical protein
MTTDRLSKGSFGTPPLIGLPIRRKVFVSYSHLNRQEAKSFVDTFGGPGGIFIPKIIGVSDTDDFINSTNTDYVIQRIRDVHIQDSTITIVLVGECAHSRRYIDWEIKASLTQGVDKLPNGLIAIQLLSAVNGADLPARLLKNWSPQHVNCFARYWRYPSSGELLRQWIEDAFEAKRTRSKWIQNPQEIMKYNSVCKVHRFTH